LESLHIPYYYRAGRILYKTRLVRKSDRAAAESIKQEAARPPVKHKGDGRDPNPPNACSWAAELSD